MPCRTGRPRLPVLLCALLLPLAPAGCSFLSPLQTSVPVVQADGLPLVLEDVHFENLVVVSSGEDSPGVLTGQALNRTRETVRVTLGIAGGDRTTTVTLPPGDPDGITRAPTNVDVGPVPVPPGALVELVVTTPAAGTTTVRVPVLAPDAGLGYYEGITP